MPDTPSEPPLKDKLDGISANLEAYHERLFALAGEGSIMDEIHDQLAGIFSKNRQRTTALTAADTAEEKLLTVERPRILRRISTLEQELALIPVRKSQVEEPVTPVPEPAPVSEPQVPTPAPEPPVPPPAPVPRKKKEPKPPKLKKEKAVKEKEKRVELDMKNPNLLRQLARLRESQNGNAHQKPLPRTEGPGFSDDDFKKDVQFVK